MLCFFVAQVNAPHPPCQCDDYNGADNSNMIYVKSGMIPMMDGCYREDDVNFTCKTGEIWSIFHTHGTNAHPVQHLNQHHIQHQSNTNPTNPTPTQHIQHHIHHIQLHPHHIQHGQHQIQHQAHLTQLRSNSCPTPESNSETENFTMFEF